MPKVKKSKTTKTTKTTKSKTAAKTTTAKTTAAKTAPVAVVAKSVPVVKATDAAAPAAVVQFLAVLLKILWILCASLDIENRDIQQRGNFNLA